MHGSLGFGRSLQPSAASFCRLLCLSTRIILCEHALCELCRMAEMIQSGQGPDGAGQAAANSLNALLKKSKKPAVGGLAYAASHALPLAMP